MATPDDGGARQAEHYAAILSDYDRHYGDETSQRYRRRFFLEPMLAGADLNDLDVADIAAGSGHTTRGILELYPRCRVHGFDVSPQAVSRYMSATGRAASIWDLTKSIDIPRQFDAAVVVGGLHHCANDLHVVLGNVAAILKPSAYLYVAEPNRETVVEPLRRLWYRADSYFDADTEAALSFDQLTRCGQPWFEPRGVQYLGGLAYYLVYNSLVFRVPLGMKTWFAAPLLWTERVTNTIPGRGLKPYFVARFQRIGLAAAEL